MKNTWTKTILTVYRYLERVANAIDKLVDRQALNSYYSSCGKSGILDIANEIIELSERKVKLINLKVLTENALENIDELYAQLLIEKYIDSDKCEMIAERHNLPLRTYFRRSEEAEDKFSSFLSKKGFNNEKLYDYLGKETWIMEVYENFNKKEEIKFFNGYEMAASL